MPGLHLIADLSGCPDPADAPLLRDASRLATLCRREAEAAGLTIVGELFHPFVDEHGAAAGVTGVLLLAESHVALHTWPERGVVTLDVYVCNVRDDRSAGAQRLVDALVAAMGPREARLQRVDRR